MTQRKGLRCSAADAYLKPARKRTNLEVPTDTHVRRIELDGLRATGVRHGDNEVAGASRRWSSAPARSARRSS